jgi:hypothetical protein
VSFRELWATGARRCSRTLVCSMKDSACFLTHLALGCFVHEETGLVDASQLP